MEQVKNRRKRSVELHGYVLLSDQIQLDGRQWIAGFRSFADPYLYVTLRWAQKTHVDLSGFDNLAAFKRRMDEDSGVQAALRAEGLD